MVSSSLLSIAFACAIPLVSALTINVPGNLTSSDPATISWSAVSGDPQLFSIFLTNPAFNDDFGIANNVPTSAMTISLTLPVVAPGDGYTIQFTNVGNQSQVFAQTPTFSIGATVSTTTSSSSTSNSTVPATAPTVSPTGTTAPGTTSTGISPATTTTSTGTGSASNTNTASQSSASVFNNAAFKLGVPETGLAASALLLALGILGL